MYVFNDYFPYALIDLIENLCKSLTKPLTASDLHKSKTLEERLKKAGKVNDASRA